MTNKRSRIILVDDMMSYLEQGRNMLKTFYEVFPAPSAAKLFEILENVIPDLILLDIEMPDMNGYETISKLKADERFSDIPVIFLTALSDVDSEREGFDLGAADYVQKPFSAPLLIKRIENQLLIVRRTKDLQESRAKLQSYAQDLEAKVLEKTEEVLELQTVVLAGVADLVEFRDNPNGGHARRIRLYLKEMVDELMKRDSAYKDELARWNIDFFLQSSHLHDIGKLTISDEILTKPGKLDESEYEIIKTHAAAGVDAIERMLGRTRQHSVMSSHARLITGTHHEKWDGSGYPIGLRGANIPLEGRMMAIADVYDALVSERPYNENISHEEAGKIIRDASGTHFDPALVEVFSIVEDAFARIARENT